MNKDTFNKIDEIRTKLHKNLDPILKVHDTVNKSLIPVLKLQAKINTIREKHLAIHARLLPVRELQNKLRKIATPFHQVMDLQKNFHLKVVNATEKKNEPLTDNELSEIVKSEIEIFRKQAEELKQLTLKDYSETVNLLDIESNFDKEIGETHNFIKETSIDDMAELLSNYAYLIESKYDSLEEFYRSDTLASGFFFEALFSIIIWILMTSTKVTKEKINDQISKSKK